MYKNKITRANFINQNEFEIVMRIKGTQIEPLLIWATMNNSKIILSINNQLNKIQISSKVLNNLLSSNLHNINWISFSIGRRFTNIDFIINALPLNVNYTKNANLVLSKSNQNIKFENDLIIFSTNFNQQDYICLNVLKQQNQNIVIGCFDQCDNINVILPKSNTKISIYMFINK